MCLHERKVGMSILSKIAHTVQFDFTPSRTRQNQSDRMIRIISPLNRFPPRHLDLPERLQKSYNRIRSLQQRELFYPSHKVSKVSPSSTNPHKPQQKKQETSHSRPRHTLGPPLNGRYPHPIFLRSGPRAEPGSQRSGRN